MHKRAWAVLALSVLAAFPTTATIPGGNWVSARPAAAAAPGEATRQPDGPDGGQTGTVWTGRSDDDGEPIVSQDATELTIRTAALTNAINAYVAGRPGEFAVAVVDHRTGATFDYRGGVAFPTASIVKVEILSTLLLQAQYAGRGLTAWEQRLAEAMIEESDNDAASALWRHIGGAAGITSTNHAFGLAATTPASDGAWGTTSTTALDQARLLDLLADSQGPLTGPSASYLFSLMGQVAAEQSWGIGAAREPDETLAVKNGWLADDANGGWIIHSIGRITGVDSDVTLVILSRSNADMWSGVAVVQEIAQMTHDYLNW